MSDNFEALRQVAVEMAKQDLNKFRLYISRLKEKFINTDGTIVTIKTENLEEPELQVFKNFISFLKSLNKDNCDLKLIDEAIINIKNDLGNCKEESFVAWINNKISPFDFLKYISETWEGDGGPEDGIKFLVEYSFTTTDPEKIF